MHGFHRSRGRIFFEVVCALGISASCVAAWMQTYAPAMLVIAGFAGLYGLVHAFDMFGRRPAAESPVEAAVVASADRGDLLVYLEPDEPELLLDSEPQAPEFAEEPQPMAVEPAMEPEPEPEAVEAVQEAEPDAVEPVEQPDSAIEPEPAVEPVQIAEPVEPAHDEPDYAPVAPLFEPQPFVRNQRAAFGRKAG